MEPLIGLASEMVKNGRARGASPGER